MTYFREVQHIRRPWIFAIFLGVAMFGGYWVLRHQQEGRSLGAAYDLVIWGNLAFTGALAVWLWFVRLETEVRDKAVYLHYRWMWRPKKIRYDEIDRVEAFEYRPIRDYGGWGLRRGHKNKEWMWNAYGSRAVRLHLSDGSTFAVGSQRPEKLAAAVEERRAAANR